MYAGENPDPFWVLSGFINATSMILILAKKKLLLCSGGAGIQLSSPIMAKLQLAYLGCLFSRTTSHLRPMLLGIQFALNG